MTQPAEARHLPSFTNLRRKTVLHLLRTWREVRGTARNAVLDDIRPDVPPEDVSRLRAKMMLCLDSPGGEVTQRAHTAGLGRTYLALSEEGRAHFLALLAHDFDIHRKTLERIAQHYTGATQPEEKLKLEKELREALHSPRSTILKQFTALPDGFKFLVNMRADLLPLLPKIPILKGLEYDLKAILSAWFDVGFLDLVEITWDSPAALLEKLIEYEAVHRVTSWDDLKNRLDADRRVFAFLHPKMPMEPLIFVHVALTQGMSDNIHALLDEKAPRLDVEKADTAIFYSISNAQKGLAGIAFGNFLIKRVVDKLTREMKQVKTYATLSPVPGFRAWLDPLVAGDDRTVLTEREAETLKLLQGEWWKNPDDLNILKPILMHLCAHYLVHEKRNGKPLDPVAAFHLFNGAVLERMNWLGDTSPKGLRQSAGIMVNYHYKLADIDENHEEFVESGKIVAAKQVKVYAEKK